MIRAAKCLIRQTGILNRFRSSTEEPWSSSSDYWEKRYQKKGNSGAGSYNRLAEFKADVLNRFVAEHRVNSVIEFGSGDGAQLRLARYPSYLGVDVSPTAVDLCKAQFANDPTKRFVTSVDLPPGTTADLSLSLDVIYHLIEDAVFDAYMHQLFSAARQFVGVYSSNMDKPWPAKHVRHRMFANWIAANMPDWRLHQQIANAYPYDASRPDDTSFADFYFYTKN